ncbi:MAG: thioredoxin family protein [Melioribacteraceae bacterium]|nr:thioredoxin family protein [Melioribacteraceae bacterium]MCF8264796.1 thioredoxin family protein [Melioribacteraceae bacterium]
MKFFASLILATLLFIACEPERIPYEPVTKFDPQRNADVDIKNAIAEAKYSNKRIILDVGGEWCVWCHRIDEFMETNETLKETLDEYFIVVKINYSKENKNEEVLSRYPEIQGYPHFFVLDKSGELLRSQNTGELENEKSYDLDKFMLFLQTWAPKT